MKGLIAANTIVAIRLLSIQNDEFCIQNDEVCIQKDDCCRRRVREKLSPACFSTVDWATAREKRLESDEPRFEFNLDDARNESKERARVAAAEIAALIAGGAPAVEKPGAAARAGNATAGATATAGDDAIAGMSVKELRAHIT